VESPTGETTDSPLTCHLL